MEELLAVITIINNASATGTATTSSAATSVQKAACGYGGVAGVDGASWAMLLMRGGEAIFRKLATRLSPLGPQGALDARPNKNTSHREELIIGGPQMTLDG